MPDLPDVSTETKLDGAVRFDLPRLLTRLNGEDAAEGFRADWSSASTRFPAGRAEAVVGELTRRIASLAQRRPARTTPGARRARWR